MIRFAFIFMLFLASCSEKKREAVSAVEPKAIKNIEEGNVVDGLPTYSFDGFEKLLQKKNDTTYVINFWATWCKPCVKELPYFEKVNENYADKKVKVVLVSLDFPENVKKQVVPFIKKREIRSEVILLDDPDGNTWIPKVDESWSGAIPATVIFNKNNRKFYERSFTLEELETEIQSIL